MNASLHEMGLTPEALLQSESNDQLPSDILYKEKVLITNIKSFLYQADAMLAAVEKGRYGKEKKTQNTCH